MGGKTVDAGGTLTLARDSDQVQMRPQWREKAHGLRENEQDLQASTPVHD